MHVGATSCDNIDAFGGVAELADAGDLKSLDFGCVGSSPTAPTRYFINYVDVKWDFIKSQRFNLSELYNLYVMPEQIFTFL